VADLVAVQHRVVILTAISAGHCIRRRVRWRMRAVVHNSALRRLLPLSARALIPGSRQLGPILIMLACSAYFTSCLASWAFKLEFHWATPSEGGAPGQCQAWRVNAVAQADLVAVLLVRGFVAFLAIFFFFGFLGSCGLSGVLFWAAASKRRVACCVCVGLPGLACTVTAIRYFLGATASMQSNI